MQREQLVRAIGMPALAGLMLLVLLALAPAAQAATITVCASGCDYTTIQAAVNAAAPGDTISVGDGTYVENVSINKNVRVVSVNGRASTTIQGVPGVGSLGAIVVTSGSTGVQIGDAGQGFTIIGIDNGSPGVENAAIYFQGNHSGAIIKGNEVVANGDAGLITEYGATISGFTIDGNIFSGQTFVGSEPGDCGFNNQFTAPNVPRQLVVMGDGGGAVPGNTNNVTFTNNQVTGKAGGYNTSGACEQGNTLVTLDAANSTITGNTFNGTTTRFATSLRVRRPGTTISGNTFLSSGLTPTTGHIFFQNATTFTMGSLVASNTFDKGVYLDPAATAGALGISVQGGVTAATPGGTVYVLPGLYTENVNVNKSLNLRGSAGGGFSAPVAIAPTAAPGVWYTDRYAPAVFESYSFAGERVLRHGVRVADSQANRPGSYSSPFYNTQGRKLDLNLSGSQQTLSIDLWLDPTMAGTHGRVAGLWGTGFNASNVVSSYPIVAFRNRDQNSPIFDPVTPGFYGWNGASYVLLRAATPADYGQWHTLSIVLTVGTGVVYLVDGEPLLTVSWPTTVKLGNVILNAYNFGQDYDVYWDNFMVGSDTPATYESVIHGLMTIGASNVEVTGLYLTNPGQTNAVLIDGSPKPSNVKIANNRLQGVGSTTLTSNVHTIFVNSGPDNVTIANNSFSNLKSGTRSVTAVGVLDSASSDPSTGLVVKNNTFSDIASASRGAYGVLINNAAGAPGAQLKDNTFSGLSGLWTHAVGLEGPTLNAVVTGNTFSGITAAGPDKAAVFFEDNPNGATVLVSGNRFNGGGYYGVAIHPDDAPGGANNLCYVVNAENNWWNSALGPTGPGAALAGPGVDYSPWWTNPAGTGTASASPGTVVQFVIPAGATTAQQQAIIDCAVGATVTYLGSPLAGGVVVNSTGITINLNNATIGPGSPAFTINADDVTINGPGVLDGNGSDPGILVNGGADNFILNGVEIREWADGVQLAGSVTSFKLVNNWIHSNTDAGLQVDSGVTVGGVVTIEGNLFKVNDGNGVQHNGAGTLKAEYNSWGHVDGPASGDGIGGNVDADPWTFAEVYIDVDPSTSGDQYVRGVNESTSFDVALKVDAKNLYGLSFKFTYNPAFLTHNGPPTFQAPWAGNCTPVGTPPVGTFAYTCYLISGPAWNGGTVATFNFTANGPALTGDGPWSTYFDISADPADTNAGAVGGVKVFVNNAGYNDPSTSDRDITDTNDGQIDITGIAQFTGFVDLQGRPNDSGALVEAKDGVTVKANATSASSGAYTTSYVGSYLLAIGAYYDVTVDRALYLPATKTWQLTTRPLTTLTTVLLLGGDADNNNMIDINDATCIGGAYGFPPSVCGTGGSSDVNGDGFTNILDLVLFGGNYGLASSPW